MFRFRKNRSGKHLVRPTFSETLESRVLLSVTHPAHSGAPHLLSPDVVEHANAQTGNITATFTFSANPISSTSSRQVIQVTYTDNTSTAQIIENSLPTSLLVTGPGGYSQQAAWQGPPNSSAGNTFTVFYNADATGAGFAPGVYTVTVPAGQVTDSFGDSNAKITATFTVTGGVPGSGPTATVSASNITSSLQGETVTVTYSDANSAVNGSGVAPSNITVTGPAGTLSISAASYRQNGNNVIATYNVNPPGGSWTVADNGTYTIMVHPNSVFDGNMMGNSAATGTFSVDIMGSIVGPTVSFSFSPMVITNPDQSEMVTVTYAASGGVVDTATINSLNLVVTDPNNVQVNVTLLSKQPAAATVKATYLINNPNQIGFWQPADNATYTVTVPAGTVKDSSGNSNNATSGTFMVDVTALTKPIASVSFAPGIVQSPTDDEVITVVYASSTALNTSKIMVSNVTVTTAGGQPLMVTLGTVTSGTDEVTVAYDVTAPETGGVWGSADNGRYTVQVGAGSVTDASGMGNDAVSGAGFSVDLADLASRTPTVAAPDVVSNTQQALVTVTFGTPTGVIDPTTITASDITVTSVNGNKLDVALQSTASNGPAAVAIFAVAPPNGVWLQSDNGSYGIAIPQNAVTDTQGNGNYVGFGTLSVAAPPVAAPFDVILAPPVVALNQAAEVFNVVYVSNVQINAGASNLNNASVTSPSNVVQGAKQIGLSGNSTNALTVTYSVAAPSGSWQTSDNGNYTIQVIAGSVYDTNGQGNPAVQTTFAVDVPVGGPPTAVISAAPVTVQGAATQAVTVIYTGTFAAIDPSTIATSNITVTGPGGNLTVSRVTSTPNGDLTTAIYTVAAPNGSWQPADDGTYTVTAVANSVKDLDGNAIAVTTGTFTVNAVVQVTVALTSSNTMPSVGVPVTYDAIVASTTGGPVPTGTVTFTIGATVLGMADVGTDGSASLATTAPASPGNVAVVATYSGDSIYPPSISAAPVDEAVSSASALKATLVGALPAFVLPGQSTKITQTIELDNMSASTVGGSVNISFFLSTGTTIDSGVIPLGITINKAVKIARSKRYAVPALLKKLPSTIPIGDYHLIAQMTDSGGGTSVAASAETLNIVPATIDLTGHFSKIPASVKLGKNGVATIVVINNGSVPAVGSLNLAVFASALQTLDPNDVAARQLTKPINLKPGKSVTIHITGLVMPSTAGSYYLIAKLDPNNALGDVNPANNIIVSSTFVTIG